MFCALNQSSPVTIHVSCLSPRNVEINSFYGQAFLYNVKQEV